MASSTTDRRFGLTSDKGIKAPVAAATLTNITLSGEQTIDGVSVLASNAAGNPDRVLVKNQTSSIENGVYDVSSGSWTRSLDSNGTQDLVTGTGFYIVGGTQAGQFWSVSSTGVINPGTSAITFSQSLTFSAATVLANLAATTGASLIGYIRAVTGAVAYTISDFLGWQKLNLLEFMTIAERIDVLSNTGSLDVTAAVQAAFTNGGVGERFAPAGTYKIVGGVTLGQRQKLVGEGQAATIFSFIPTVDETACFTASNGAAVCNQGELKGFTITGGGTKLKIGIDLQDTSMFNVEDIAMTNLVTGNDEGIRLQGREFTTISRCELGYVDKPVVIKANVNGGIIDCDHLYLRDNYFISTAGHYHITIDKGVKLSSLTVDGAAWVLGDGAVYWDDTGVGASSSNPFNMSFTNIRCEGQADATKYLFYIAHDAAYTTNISFTNIYGGLTAKGYYIRQANNVSWTDDTYVNGSSAEALNVDSTVWKMSFRNSTWQSGTTASLTGQRLLSGTIPVTGPLPDNAYYETTAVGVANFGKTYTLGLTADNTDALSARVVRRMELRIGPGTTASTLKCEVRNEFNGDVIAITDDIPKAGGAGNFALNAAGSTISVIDAGITGTVKAILACEFRNNSGTALYWPRAFVTGTGIDFNIKSDHSGTNQDLTALTGTQSAYITYLTDA